MRRLDARAVEEAKALQRSLADDALKIVAHVGARKGIRSRDRDGRNLVTWPRHPRFRKLPLRRHVTSRAPATGERPYDRG
jgi:hypothetical protein